MNNNIFFNIPLDFGDSTETIKKEDVIAFKKIVSQLNKDIQDDKSTICRICNQKTTSFCNSHSIPHFCLKQIAKNGMVISPSIFFDSPLFKYETGISKTGTFRLICEKCDHEVFCEYEQPKNYFGHPSEKMLAQIAMKTSLKLIYKRILEISMYQKLSNSELSDFFLDPYFEKTLAIHKRDYEDYSKDLKYAKKAIENTINPQYQIGYYKKLDYTIPIAAQIELMLITDLKGDIVNNIYNESLTYNLQPLHICLFPLEQSSIILLFFKSGHNRLRKFCKQIKELIEYEQLQLISYVCFLYCEDIYMNKDIQQFLRKYDAVKKAIETSSISMGLTDNPEKVTKFERLSSVKDIFNLVEYKKFPNLLSEEFKINKT